MATSGAPMTMPTAPTTSEPMATQRQGNGFLSRVADGGGGVNAADGGVAAGGGVASIAFGGGGAGAGCSTAACGGAGCASSIDLFRPTRRDAALVRPSSASF